MPEPDTIPPLEGDAAAPRDPAAIEGGDRSAPGPEAVDDRILFHDFEPDHPAASAAAESPEPACVLVVETPRRRRWSPLVPPLLIAAAACGILVYQPAQPRWLRPVGRVPTLPAVTTAATDVATPGFREVAVVQESVLELPDLSELAPRPDAPRVRPRPVATRPFRPVPAMAVASVAMKPAEALNAVVEDDITREARLRRVERLHTEGLMEKVPEIEREVARVARRSADEERRTFLSAVRKLLEEHGAAAGPPIWNLAVSMQPEAPPPGVEARVERILAAGKGRLDASGRIALLRQQGLPEPFILDRLVREQLKVGVARKGTTSREKAVLRAARRLLEVPLPPSLTPDEPADDSEFAGFVDPVR